jgi:hypothetical protein
VSKIEKMRTKQLKILLEFAFKNGHQVLIKGAPGVGKSDVVTQAAYSCLHTDGSPYDLMIVHPAVQDPTQASGIPWVIQNPMGTFEVQTLPLANIKQMINAKRPLVVFIDDLGQAAPAVQAAYMQLLLARELDGQRISENVIFVAATNRREDAANVGGILLPVRSRFQSIVQLEPHIDDWCEWAIQNGMPHQLISFLRFKPQYLLDENAAKNKDIENSYCPRTIASLGRMINDRVPKEVRFEAYKGCVGESFTVEFQAYCNVYLTLPTISQIESDPYSASIPNEISGQFAVMGMIVENLSSANVGEMITYMKRLRRDELLMAMMKDGMTKCPSIANNMAFIQWASQNANELMSV